VAVLGIRRSNLISIAILVAGKASQKGIKTAITELQTATFLVGDEIGPLHLILPGFFNAQKPLTDDNFSASSEGWSL
jgi:hypothetical protein